VIRSTHGLNTRCAGRRHGPALFLDEQLPTAEFAGLLTLLHVGFWQRFVILLFLRRSQMNGSFPSRLTN